MSQESMKVPFLSLSLIPDTEFWMTLQNSIQNRHGFFDTLEKFCLTSCRKTVIFFPIAVVLEVENKCIVGSSPRQSSSLSLALLYYQ